MSSYRFVTLILSGACFVFALTSCRDYSEPDSYRAYTGSYYSYHSESDYESRLPAHLDTHGEKLVLVDPSDHVWGAYDRDGSLVKAGPATAGGHICPDDPDRSCTTSIGTYRVNSLGDESCKSTIYPKPKGGGLMPYCMYFSGGEALHGSPDGTVVEDNISHGCVRMRISDAEWMRYNFIQLGTKVIVEPY